MHNKSRFLRSYHNLCIPAIKCTIVVYNILNYIWLPVWIPYSRKFWIGANFSIFRMMPRRTKIKSMKSFTFEVVITSNTRVLAKLVGVAFPHAHIRNKNTNIYSEGLTAIYTKFAPSKISRYTVLAASTRIQNSVLHRLKHSRHYIVRWAMNLTPQTLSTK